MSHNILQIFTSIRPRQESYSARMGDYCTKKLKEHYQGAEISELDLYKNPFPYLTAETDEAAHTPLELRSETQNALLDKVSMEPLVKNDIYVISLAGYMYDVPAVFKSFLEHLVQYNITLNPDDTPLLKNKKIIIITAWGEDYDSVTPEIGYEFIVKKSFEYIGLKDIKFFNIYRTDDISSTEDTVQNEIDEYIKSFG